MPESNTEDELADIKRRLKWATVQINLIWLVLVIVSVAYLIQAFG